LGTLYEHGLGVPQDYAEAAKWYRKASDQGNSSAQTALSGLYTIGRGVPQDFVAAHMWMNLAASLQTDGAGSLSPDLQKGAAKLRDDLATMMTPQQIAEAQRLAREWKPTTTK
jgi:TPR repeat protein